MPKKKKNKMSLNKFILSILTLLVFLFAEAPAVRAEMSNLQTVDAKESFRGIRLFWAKPLLQETEGVVVIRKESACPISVADGKEIYRGNGLYFEDTDVKAGLSYCYGAFIYDSSGNASTLRRTVLIQKLGPLAHFLSQIGENNNLIIGIIIVIILFWINNVTMKKKREGNRVIMKV
jgi:hypothetical protein